MTDDKSNIIEDFTEFVQSVVQQNEVDRKTIEVLKKNVDNVYQSYRKATSEDTKNQYFSLFQLLSGYLYILENGHNSQEAFEYLQEKFDLTDDFVDRNKNRYSPHLRKVVKEADSHPKQKQMKREGTMDRNALTSSKTPNQQFRRLSHQVNLHDTIKSLEEVDKHQQKQLESLSGRVEVAEMKHELTEERLGLLDGGLPPKEVAAILKNKGYTQEQVAEVINKSVRTVKRWWGDL